MTDALICNVFVLSQCIHIQIYSAPKNYWQLIYKKTKKEKKANNVNTGKSKVQTTDSGSTILFYFYWHDFAKYRKHTANALYTCKQTHQWIPSFSTLPVYCTQMQNQWSNYMSSMYSTQLTIALGCVGSLTRLDIKSSVYLLLQLSGHNYQVDYAICFHNPLSFDRKWHRVIHYNL